MADIKNFNIVGIASDVQMGSRGGRLKYDSENGRFDFVQSNNTTLEDVRFGTVESGAWQADIIASQFGGTGMDASTSTGVLQFVDGVASVTAVSLSNTSYVTGILSVENGGTGSNTGGLTTSANISAAFFIGNGSQLTGIVGSGAVDSVNGFTGAVTLDTDDIGEGNANLYYTTARANTAIAAYQGNINTAGSITAASFTGDGSDLTDVRSDTVEEKVINKSGGTLPKGTPVFATGGVTADALWVNACDAGNAATMPCIGVLSTALNNDAEGRAIIVGRISGVDTSAFAAGDEIYVAVGGGYTKVPPASESNVIQFLGTVTRVDSTKGGGIVKLAPPRAESNLNNGNVFIGNANNSTVTAALSTSIVPEGTNLYYSNTRVNAFIQNSITTTDIDEGANLYYSNARVNAFIQSSITTADIDEGANLYYTTARANTAIDNYIVTAVENANVKLKQFAETVVALGNVSGDISSNIDLDLGTIFTMTATGNITINSMANAVPGVSATLIITQDGTGNRLLTSNWKYADAANVLSNAANTTDIVSALFAGNVYYATLSKGYA